LVLAIIGAVSDSRYIKAGGRPPSKRDRIISSWLAVVLVVFVVVLGLLGASAEGIGRLIFFLLMLYWFAWELGR
jgi:quinol-cytochrome oxidoreductase complex cytochrome b subunit